MRADEFAGRFGDVVSRNGTDWIRGGMDHSTQQQCSSAIGSRLFVADRDDLGVAQEPTDLPAHRPVGEGPDLQTQGRIGSPGPDAPFARARMNREEATIPTAPTQLWVRLTEVTSSRVGQSLPLSPSREPIRDSRETPVQVADDAARSRWQDDWLVRDLPDPAAEDLEEEMVAEIIAVVGAVEGDHRCLPE